MYRILTDYENMYIRNFILSNNPDYRNYIFQNCIKNIVSEIFLYTYNKVFKYKNYDTNKLDEIMNNFIQFEAIKNIDYIKLNKINFSKYKNQFFTYLRICIDGYIRTYKN